MMVKEKKADIIKRRAIEHGLLFIKRDATVRTVAKETGLSKSTVHLDLLRLQEVHPGLWEKVKEKLALNFALKHIRGGEVTRKKAERKRKDDSK